jgi:hypothetical protein
MDGPRMDERGNTNERHVTSHTPGSTAIPAGNQLVARHPGSPTSMPRRANRENRRIGDRFDSPAGSWSPVALRPLLAKGLPFAQHQTALLTTLKLHSAQSQHKHFGHGDQGIRSHRAHRPAGASGWPPGRLRLSNIGVLLAARWKPILGHSKQPFPPPGLLGGPGLWGPAGSRRRRDFARFGSPKVPWVAR